MIIGFTGTQTDLTAKQFDALLDLILELRPHEAHHGDCVGADERLHQTCAWLNDENPNYQIKIHIHPPIVDTKRAWCVGADEMYATKDYLVRNHDIVDASNIVIACPNTNTEKMRSGTWSTWRYAKKTGKMTYLILPTGEVQCDSP